MCYINGCRVSRAEFIRYKQLVKELSALPFKRVQNGFDYRDWPIVRPINNGADVIVEMAHWEFIPSTVRNVDDLLWARKSGKPWLNARCENLFLNEKGRRSMWADAAVNGRCLVLSTGFFEYRHVPKIGKKGQELKASERYPYFVSTKQPEPKPFYMAGIYREWTNEDMAQSANTFAIITGNGNELTNQVHNTKKRMPTILTQELAEEWLSKDLPKERIIEIASFRYDANEMFAHPVSKDFLYSDEPEKEFYYPELPALEKW